MIKQHPLLKPPQRRRCLLLIPRSEKEGAVDSALRNAVADAGFRVLSVSRPTAEAVSQVDCVIAEASGRDSNTMYSLGIARALGRPTVIISRSSALLPSELSGLQVVLYEHDPASLKILQNTVSGILRSLGPVTGPRRLMLAARNENLFSVNWDRLEPQDTDNLCVELLAQMGFRLVQWEPRAKEFDLVAELPKKDPDGFEFKERWYVTLGRSAPPERLMDMLREPEYFFHRLRMYSDEKGMESLAQQPVTVLVILLREGIQRKLFDFDDGTKRGRYQYNNIRLRVWDRNYMTSLVYQFPQIGFKYFSDEGQDRAKFRKSIDELYSENVALTEQKSAAILALQDERNKRVRAERDAVWKDIAFSAAHKIGNPIFAIETNLDPLLKRINEGRRQEAAVVVQDIRASVEKAKGIIDQFKSLTRAQALQPTPTLLLPLFVDACKVAREKGVACEITCDPTLRVMADPERIGECFDELVSNSLHWLDKPDKAISLEAGPVKSKELPEGLLKGRYVRILFRDNGKGVPVENKSKIFNAFFTTWEHGTGLGLALVRRIVEGLGGAISETGIPGQGAFFEILLPSVLPRMQLLSELRRRKGVNQDAKNLDR